MNNLPYRPDPKPAKSQWEAQHKIDPDSLWLHGFVWLVIIFGGFWPLVLWHDAAGWIGCFIWWGVLLAPLAVIGVMHSSPARKKEKEFAAQYRVQQDLAREYPYSNIPHFFPVGSRELPDARIVYGPLISSDCPW